MSAFRRLAICLVAMVAGGSVQAQTLVLVRHAEKAALPAADPPLTAEGRARAEALVGVLRHARISSILTSQFVRTRETAAPLAAQAGVAVQQASTAGGMVQHIATLVAMARRAPPESTVVVVGHSNTLPELARALGHPAPAIGDCEYDGLMVIRLGAAAPSVVVARYGEPSRC
jgi:broad specificity phosphatase PhoE